MKQFFAFVKKEYYHIIRDWRTLLVLIGMPIAQIVLFGFALSNEVKNSRISVLDQSKDAQSIQLIEKIQSSKYFDVVKSLEHEEEIDQQLRSGFSKMVLLIPPKFSENLAQSKSTQLQMITDGGNPNLATTLVNYASAIVRDFQITTFHQSSPPYQINVIPRMLYNPQLRGEYTFVPGVIALVLALVCTMMTSVSIVREKEMGNMEVLLVSPMNPLMVIISKAVPYVILSLFILSIILLLSVHLLGVPIRGSLLLLYGISFIFIIAVLALGLVISSITNSQQVAMMISLMGLLLPTLLFGGFMFPIESMPKILQWISNIVPAKWFFYSVSAIMIKGLGFSAIIKETLILTGFAILFLGISFKKFNIRLA